MVQLCVTRSPYRQGGTAHVISAESGACVTQAPVTITPKGLGRDRPLVMVVFKRRVHFQANHI